MKILKYILLLLLAVAAGIAGGVGASRFMPQKVLQQEEILTANEFRLTDEQGRVVAFLKSEQGRPVLSFLNRDDTTRVTLGVRSTGDLVFALNTEDGKPRALLGVTYAGAPFLEMLNKEEKIMWAAP